jgi:hypothetical protein
LLLVFALVLSPFARGETLEQYDVEVIVFRNLSGQSDGEQWPLRDPVTGFTTGAYRRFAEPFRGLSGAGAQGLATDGP